MKKIINIKTENAIFVKDIQYVVELHVYRTHEDNIKGDFHRLHISGKDINGNEILKLYSDICEIKFKNSGIFSQKMIDIPIDELIEMKPEIKKAIEEIKKHIGE